MKKIFQQLFQSKSDKESKKLTAWVNDLAEMDDIAALKFCTLKLLQIFDEEQLSTQQKLDLIIEIEELNQPRLEKLATQYAHVTNLRPDLETSMSETCYTYSRQSYICHLRLIELVINPEKFNLEGNMPILLLARAINAGFVMSKWRMMMQQTPPSKVWLQTYMLYKIAYRQNLLNTPIELFPLAPSTTLSAFIVQIAMLGELLQASLQKHHVEIASKLLVTWLTRAHISNKNTPEQYLFFIDLERDAPAKRMRKMDLTEDCRYWELDDFERQLQVAITVTDRGEIPESLVFAKIDSVKKLNETLNILHAEWRKAGYVRQRRKESREATLKHARVNAGIIDISNQVLHANQIHNGLRMAKQGKSLDELLRGHTVLKQSSNSGNLHITSGSLDTWIITDQSKQGLGARVNKYANILARTDKLIGLVMDDEPGKVIIGTIRSAKPTHGNQLKVGIEIMSHQAIWLQLQPAQENSSFLDTISEMNAQHRGAPVETGIFSGVYLAQEPGISQSSYLLLPKISYRPNTKYVIHMAGKVRRADLGAPESSQDDWVKVPIPF